MLMLLVQMLKVRVILTFVAAHTILFMHLPLLMSLICHYNWCLLIEQVPLFFVFVIACSFRFPLDKRFNLGVHEWYLIDAHWIGHVGIILFGVGGSMINMNMHLRKRLVELVPNSTKTGWQGNLWETEGDQVSWQGIYVTQPDTWTQNTMTQN